jgi:hypothetical protein
MASSSTCRGRNDNINRMLRLPIRDCLESVERSLTLSTTRSSIFVSRCQSIGTACFLQSASQTACDSWLPRFSILSRTFCQDARTIPRCTSLLAPGIMSSSCTDYIGHYAFAVCTSYSSRPGLPRGSRALSSSSSDASMSTTRLWSLVCSPHKMSVPMGYICI